MRRITIANLHGDLQERLKELRKDSSAVEKSREVVRRALADGNVYYGINTGLGAFATKRIDASQVKDLQRNLILSHAVGVGEPVPRAITSLMLQLKIHSLSLGYSGVSPETFDRLLQLAEADLVPVVPSRGSLGASGDLAPLAHMCLPLLGCGEFWNPDGSARIPAAQCLRQHGISPISLQAKDGLALINGTQFMSSYGSHVLNRCRSLVKLADMLASLSLEAMRGSIRPFDERVQNVRPHEGQGRAAYNVRLLLQDSAILESHRDCGKVQDPYSLRCVPQVHGACRDALANAANVVETEINSVTDNPLVFPDGEIISCGNFHGEPLAIMLDLAAIALAELASISERRTYLLLEGRDALPAMLMKSTGANSGFMILQYTAAALVSENKVLCHPASVDSIPTSMGQEDHVSMGSISALKLLQVFTHVEHVLAIELITAAQALDYRRPMKAGSGVEIVHEHIRSQIPHREADGEFGDCMNSALGLIRSPVLIDQVEKTLGQLR